MKFLIVDHYYPAFLQSYYNKLAVQSGEGLGAEPYAKQQAAMMRAMFSTADFYSRALSEIGHPSETVVVNDDRLQAAWLAEQQPLQLSAGQQALDALWHLSTFLQARKATQWEQEVLRQQVRAYKPDVLYIHNLSYLSQNFLRSLKPQVKLIVGQIACPIPPYQSFSAFDLIITSLPHFVKEFARRGVSAAYLPLCFEPRILKDLPKPKRDLPLTFVGGISPAHQKGTSLIEHLAEQLPLEIWGYGKDQLSPGSAAYQNHHGDVWGREMFEMFLRSQITINRHSQIAENSANNLRLFEATGCGALLVTDAKQNLDQLFAIDKEIVTYRNASELLAKLQYYRSHPAMREKIAAAGQRRTLREHTYQRRMRELVHLVEKHWEK